MCDYRCEVKESDSDTIIMVIILVAGVGGVFILFALMALCYRYVLRQHQLYSFLLLPI